MKSSSNRTLLADLRVELNKTVSRHILTREQADEVLEQSKNWK